MSQTCWPPAQSETATSAASRAPVEINQAPLEPICLSKTRLLKRIWIKRSHTGLFIWIDLKLILFCRYWELNAGFHILWVSALPQSYIPSLIIIVVIFIINYYFHFKIIGYKVAQIRLKLTL